MAAIVPRRHKNGSTVFQVRWRGAGRQQHSETFPTEDDARRFRGMVDAAGQRYPAGWIPGFGLVPAEPEGPTLTLDAWAERAIQARPRASARTRADYLRDYRRHVSPALGSKALADISREDAGRWLTELSETTLSAKTIRNLHGMVSSIFKDAEIDGHIDRNPLAGLSRRLPVARHEAMVFMTRDEFRLLHERVDPFHVDFVAFLVLTGLRWGEATALRVQDVHVRTSRVAVTRAWKRQPDNSFVIGEPKTPRSRRLVALPDFLMQILEPRLAGQRSDWLFPSLMGRPLHHGNFTNRIWKRAVGDAQAAGLGVAPRIHDLRHTHASWLIDQGVDLVRIQRRLGHESIQTTVDRYGHLLPDSDEEVLHALGEVWRLRDGSTTAKDPW